MDASLRNGGLRGTDLSRTRRIGIQALAPAAIPPAALARVPNGVAPDGLLRASVRNDPLTIAIPFSVEYLVADGSEHVRLLFDGVEVARSTPIGPDDYGLDIEIDLPASYRTEGAHSISYLLWGGPFDGEIGQGPTTPILVDLTPPGLPFLGRPEFDRDLETNGLSSQRLTELGNILKGKVPSYNGVAVGDRVTGMVDGIALDPPYEVGAAGAGGDIILDFPRATLESAGDGRKQFVYQVEDRAGNLSGIAEATFMNIALVGAIADLAPPTVPLNDDDGLINDDDARTPVGVRIPGNAGILENDQVVVSWGGQRLLPALVGAGHVGGDPLFDVLVPYSAIAAAWSGSGTSAVDVTYEVLRGGLPLGQATAPARVNVNLELPGGVDPDPEVPSHGLLGLPTVRSAGGQENFIPPEDSDLDATAFIPFFNTAPTPVPVFRLGDEVQILWNGVPVGNWHPVTATEISAEADLQLVVPGAVVATTSGVIPVAYHIRRQVGTSPGSTPIYNTVLSANRSVEVRSKADLPGGGNPLPLSEFTGRDVGRNALSYSIILAANGTPLSVPYYINKAIGDVIDISIQLYWGTTGAGGPFQPPYTAQYRVGPNDVDKDYPFHILKEFFFQLRDQGRPAVGQARASYTVTSDATGPGGVSSAETAVILDMRV